MQYVTGVTAYGERLRFERWAYERWSQHQMNDDALGAQLARCVYFTPGY